MNKKEVQARVLQNGKPLALSKFSWNGKTNTFSSNEDNLVIDFGDINYCTFNTGHNCTFKTGSGCTFKTGYNCTFKTGEYCTFKTWSECTFKTGSDCVVVTRNADILQTIQLKENCEYKIAPYNIKGYIKDGIYSETGKPAIICDGILSEVISQKGNIYKVINYGKSKKSYIVKDGDICSHGETLEQAKESLIYKISNRDTTPYKSWKLTDTKTKEELIKAYRVITGACESGTRYFCENTNIPDKCTVKKAIELTKGQYNQEKFKEFFKGVK